MKIYIGSDHGGFDLKQLLVHYLGVKQKLDVEDVGDEQPTPQDDYPIYAQKLVNAMLASDETDVKGILVCRGGQGMAMAANRHRNIRAAVCWNEYSARKAREDNDSNVLCLAADELSVSEVKDIVHTWLETPFSNASRHQRRLQELDSM